MNQENLDEIKNIVEESLNEAERIWGQVGAFFSEAAIIEKKAGAVSTQIPGYQKIESGKPQIDKFIAIVVDMRNSTKHLMTAISSSKVSQLQRVFYETSALLPALAKVIYNNDGSVTEYLGDGVLGLFRVDEKDKSNAVYAANNTAKDCIDVLQKIVNPILKKRYSLPELEIGIGLAYSKAVVTLVGLPEFLSPKVFGECVFRATKLSCGVNETIVDEALKNIWPKSEDGRISFELRNSKDREILGYLIKRKKEAQYS